MRCCSKEEDLFQEIYGKFADNYADLVEEHTQTLLKIEENEKHKKRNWIAISLFGILIVMSFVGFSPKVRFDLKFWFLTLKSYS